MNTFLEEHGYWLYPDRLEPAQLEPLSRELGPISLPPAGGRKGGLTSAGRRDLLGLSAGAELARHPVVQGAVQQALGPQARPVRGILFDKQEGTNWKVPWHQDLAIAVRERLPVLSGWSVKDGIPHVQASADILERMVAVRIHLDESHADNGPLRVLPGSHRVGRLDSAAIETWKERGEVVCLAPRGGILLMRPLLLHASSAARVPSSRRVVHLEFADTSLPAGLRWYYCQE